MQFTMQVGGKVKIKRLSAKTNMQIASEMAKGIDFAIKKNRKSIVHKKNGAKYKLVYTRSNDILMFSLEGFGDIMGCLAGIELDGQVIDQKLVSLDGDVTLCVREHDITKAIFFVKKYLEERPSLFD